MREILLALPSIFLIGIANSLLKWRITFLNANGINLFKGQFIKFIFDPFIFFGGLATLISILWWLNIIPSVRIGVVYPIIQAGAILVTLIISSILLKENISSIQLFGILIITLGVILISR